MNHIILQQAIEHVKTVVAPNMDLCQVCHKNTWIYPPETEVEVIGTPTAIGLTTCRNCFDNLLIAIGEISAEY
ncbi:MAG: hypothetical protein WC799_21970 [Desulfobacteraceae bacterium]|jgi:hypothetical protein